MNLRFPIRALRGNRNEPARRIRLTSGVMRLSLSSLALPFLLSCSTSMAVETPEAADPDPVVIVTSRTNDLQLQITLENPGARFGEYYSLQFLVTNSGKDTAHIQPFDFAPSIHLDIEDRSGKRHQDSSEIFTPFLFIRRQPSVAVPPGEAMAVWATFNPIDAVDPRFPAESGTYYPEVRFRNQYPMVAYDTTITLTWTASNSELGILSRINAFMRHRDSIGDLDPYQRDQLGPDQEPGRYIAAFQEWDRQGALSKTPLSIYAFYALHNARLALGIQPTDYQAFTRERDRYSWPKPKETAIPFLVGNTARCNDSTDRLPRDFCSQLPSLREEVGRHLGAPVSKVESLQEITVLTLTSGKRILCEAVIGGLIKRLEPDKAE